ncbi:MAG: hypothetical protein FD147_690 [Chloroflexi bacterium]|nr:MAG: hypothetical protein FD147_690 [Chloroflexota bacterium]MBA4376223.1 hypothetical protein [Anaerolinea sp.]
MINSWKALLCIMGVILVLAACKPQQPPYKGTPVVDQTSAASTPVMKTLVPTKVPEVKGNIQKLNGLQIQFLHPWTAETSRVIDLLVDEFNQTNEWGIHVIVLAPGSAGLVAQEFREDAMKHRLFDVVAAPVSMVFSSDLQKENILDLNPYVLSSKYGLNEAERNDFLPAFWDEDVVDGKRYGIPAQRTAAVIFYNVTWASETSFSENPETTTDFRKQVCAANASMKTDNDRSNDALGGWIVNTQAITMMSWFNSFDAIPTAKSVEKFESEKYAQAFEYLYHLQKDSCAWQSRIPQPYDYFANRQTLAYSGVMQDIMKQSAAFERSDNKDKWVILAYPSIGEYGDQRIISEGPSYTIVKSDSEQQLAAWLFIRWMASPAHQARLLQTSGTLPLGSKVLSLLSDFRSTYPQWNEVIPLLPVIKPAAPQANMETVKMVLEDAGWQLFRTEFKADQIPALLTQLDETINELTGRTP